MMHTQKPRAGKPPVNHADILNKSKTTMPLAEETSHPAQMLLCQTVWLPSSHLPFPNYETSSLHLSFKRGTQDTHVQIGRTPHFPCCVVLRKSKHRLDTGLFFRSLQTLGISEGTHSREHRSWHHRLWMQPATQKKSMDSQAEGNHQSAGNKIACLLGIRFMKLFIRFLTTTAVLGIMIMVGLGLPNK